MQLVAAWSRLRSTYWFVPSIMTAVAVGLAVLLVALDRSSTADAPWMGWVYGGGADGARSLLSAVAGSTITVVSLTFSVTVVALTVSSQHFGPRLLSNFMRDAAAQVVLGMFIGTFAFCLVVLRTVQGRGEAYEPFVPHLAVTGAVVLALLSVAALIYYLHHVAASMQVAQIALNVARDLEAAIDRLFPEDAGAEPESPARGLPHAPPGATVVTAGSSGYVQAIDLDALLALAEKHATTVWLRARPGDFVTDGTQLATVSPAPANADPFAESLRGAYVVGIDRTPWQDAEFAVQQLVEVALHALSPGINEPFTAITCIDRLGQGLDRLATRRVPSGARTDASLQVRLVAEPGSFSSLLASAFDPITLYAGPNPAIYSRLLETLAGLGRRVRRQPDRAAVRDQASSIRETALREIRSDRARRRVEDLHGQVLAALGADERDEQGGSGR
jgi:uncharacterized membrane protein